MFNRNYISELYKGGKGQGVKSRVHSRAGTSVLRPIYYIPFREWYSLILGHVEKI